MTAVELVSVLQLQGPTWARTFSPEQVLEAIATAKDKLKVEAYVQIPQTVLPAIVSQAAVHLNSIDPDLMRECLDKDYGGAKE